MLENSIRQFIDSAASKTPVPGGGSVSALAGALGSSMGHMACVFSTSDKYADVKDKVEPAISHFSEAAKKFSAYVEDDAKAYEGFNKAMKLPKSTPEEKTLRRTEMQNAIRGAIEVPRKVCVLAHESLEVISGLSCYLNKNLISDVGVSGLMLRAAFEGARLNVEINLAFLKDEKACEEIRHQVEGLAKEVEELASDLYDEVLEEIQG